MSAIKRLASYAGVDVLAAMLGLITSPITTRLLSVEQYGAISYLAAVWTPFLVARYAGIDYSFVFFKARNGVDQNALIIACTKVVGISAVLVISCFLSFVLVTDFFKDHQIVGEYELLFFVLGLLPIALVDWLLLLLRFSHKATIYAKIAIVQKLSVIVLALPAMYLVEQEVRLLVYFIVAAVFPIISFFYAVSLISSTSLRPFTWGSNSSGQIKELLSYGIFLVPGGVFYALIAVSDKLLVGAIIGVKGVALLALAIALSAPIVMMKKWVSLVLNPMITDWLRRLDQKSYTNNLNLVLQCLCVIFLPVVALMTIWAKPLVELLYIEQYYLSATMIPLLAFSGVLAVLTLVAISTVLITQKRSTTLKVNAFGLLANVGLAVFLIPEYGVVGAVWGTMLAEFLILLAWGYLGTVHYKVLKLSWQKILPVVMLVFVFVAFGSFYYYQDISFFERIFVSIICMLTSLLYLWLNADNFKQCKALL